MLGRRREKHERELADLDAFRHVRRAADEDVTRFGEELSGLHFDTLTTELDEAMRVDYQRALDAYEDSKAALRRSSSPGDVTSVTAHLADGRFHHACVLAAQSGAPRPERRPPCFFDPAHGPASRDVEWAPIGGVPREVPVCFRDAERLAAGTPPEVRMVRLGDRKVAWFASGPLYAAWAGGWYDDLVKAGRIEAERLTMTYAGGPLAHQPGVQLPLAAMWNDPGAWSGGGMIGGHDFSGYGGGDFVGGGDFGFGGGDGGGGGGGDSG